MLDGKIDVYPSLGYVKVGYRGRGDGGIVVTEVSGLAVGFAGVVHEGQEFESVEALERACNGPLATPLGPPGKTDK